MDMPTLTTVTVTSKRRQLYHPATANSQAHQRRPEPLNCKSPQHSSTGRWPRGVSLSTFSAQGFMNKTSHSPHSISTTTILCAKVFFSNLISAHLEQHKVKRTQTFAFQIFIPRHSLPLLPTLGLLQRKLLQWFPKASGTLSHLAHSSPEPSGGSLRGSLQQPWCVV